MSGDLQSLDFTYRRGRVTISWRLEVEEASGRGGKNTLTSMLKAPETMRPGREKAPSRDVVVGLLSRWVLVRQTCVGCHAGNLSCPGDGAPDWDWDWDWNKTATGNGTVETGGHGRRQPIYTQHLLGQLDAGRRYHHQLTGWLLARVETLGAASEREGWPIISGWIHTFVEDGNCHAA